MPPRTLPRPPRGVDIDRDVGRLAAFAQDASGRTGAVPLAIARPAAAEQLPDLMRWAGAHDIPLVPVSSPGGPRRGGDTLASRPAVMVDLTGFDRVRHVDGRDHIALIEPGVTFDALDLALRPHGLRAYRPLLPRAGKSVLASYLDREPITSPAEHWDSGDPLGALEVVFGDGTTFRTGGASVPGRVEDNLADGLRFMVSVGPVATDFGRVLQGAQGALGIVTWATVYCEPTPALEEARLFAAADLQPLLALCQRICRRRLPGQLFLLNATQAAMMICGGADGPGFAELARRAPPWMLYLNHGVPDYFPEERLAYERAALDADAAALGLAASTGAGGVTAEALRARQARSPAENYKDAALGGHAEFFFLSQLDRTPGQLEGAVSGADPVGVYIQPLVHGVNCHVELSFLHPATAEGAADAGAARDRAVAACLGAGGFLSRPKAPWGDAAFAADPHIVPYLRQVKRMFDPKAILAPGRLCF